MLFGTDLEFERHEANAPILLSTWGPFLLNERPELVAAHFHVVETASSEVALVYRNGRLERVQSPSERTLFWKTADSIRVELIDVEAKPVLSRLQVAELDAHAVRAKVVFAAVGEGQVGLLFLDAKFVETLGPGRHAIWSAVRTPSVEVMDLRTQTLEISGQEIMTADKVALRVNIWAEYQVVDPVKARQSFSKPIEHLYRVVQMAVRQSLAKRSLDAVLEARTDLDASVAETVRQEAASFGFRVGAMALKDIIPPGEVRDMLHEVVAAEKKAQANLILRREETAATRSLLNTARLMAEHPLLVRMKELETLEKVAAKVEKIHLYGGFDGVLKNLVSIGEEKSRERKS